MTTEGPPSGKPRRFAYADPPYPGCAHLYPEKTEVPLAPLLERLDVEYPDGWAVSTHVRGLLEVSSTVLRLKARVASWGRTPGALHPPLHTVDAWEPVIFRTSHRYLGGSPVLTAITTPTINRGFMAKRHGELIGSKPPEFNRWILRLLGFRAGDSLDDIYPGLGGMGREVRAWKHQVTIGGDCDFYDGCGEEIEVEEAPTGLRFVQHSTEDPEFPICPGSGRLSEW